MFIRPLEEMYRRGCAKRARGRIVIRVGGRTIRLSGKEVGCLGTLRAALRRRGLLRPRQIEMLCQPHGPTERLLFGAKPVVGFESLF